MEQGYKDSPGWTTFNVSRTRQENGQSPEIIQEKIPGIAHIAARRRLRRLGVFGSATSDRFDPSTSDIDFVAEFEPMDAEEHAEAYFGLADDLARLFCRWIDLVELSEVRNQIFRDVVEGDLQGYLGCRVRRGKYIYD